ncbi:MAG TPA: hypothetical protein VMB78_02890 [Dissulfurispiraceae bacterium]|nr:hypothetical protein [Dissulfurispiraceae bacterium]
MYIYRGGQLVDEGVYLESARRGKVTLRAGGFLPGTDNDVYFKIPESYLLVPVLLLGLVLSMALPYGIGIAIFAASFIIHNLVLSFISFCGEVFRELTTYFVSAYKPNACFFSGNSKRLKKRERTDRIKKG